MGYLPVRLTTLKPDIELGFDLYVQLPHKMVRYVAAEFDIEIERIQNLKSKKVRKLFINDDEEPLYQQYIDRCLDTVMNDANASTEQKAEVVSDASEATAERIMTDPHSEKSYNAAQTTSQKLIDVLAKNDDLLKGIFDRKLSEDDDTQDARMHKHAVNTSSLCISFAEHLKFPKKVIEHLAVASLFHDVAFGQMDDKGKALFFKPLDQMSAEELTLYKQHPKMGAEILQDKAFASEEVMNLILSHEERIGGEGFPNGLPKLEADQELLALCCYYDQRVTCFGEDRIDVLSDLPVSQLGKFNLQIINKFKEFISKAGLKS